MYLECINMTSRDIENFISKAIKNRICDWNTENGRKNYKIKTVTIYKNIFHISYFWRTT